jgi:hypothetical protein
VTESLDEDAQCDANATIIRCLITANTRNTSIIGQLPTSSFGGFFPRGDSAVLGVGWEGKRNSGVRVMAKEGLC